MRSYVYVATDIILIVSYIYCLVNRSRCIFINASCIPFVATTLCYQSGPQEVVKPVRPWPDQLWQLKFCKVTTYLAMYDSSYTELESGIPLSCSLFL